MERTSRWRNRICDRGALLSTMLLSLVVLCLTSVLWSQTSTTGILKGAVTDPSGRVVQNADVRVTNQGTQEERTVKTNQDGTYVVPLLPPGSYQVDVESAGFSRATRSGVVIAVTETTVLNFPLTVGKTETTIEVNAAPPVVATSENALGDVVTTRQVESLPLVNRNFT